MTHKEQRKIFIIGAFAITTLILSCTALVYWLLQGKKVTPKEAVELYETIEEICLQNDLEPEFEVVKGHNGNLFFNITCK